MKKRVNKTIVIVTALLTFGALGVTAKMHYMHHQKHTQYAQSDNTQDHCFMWNGCETEEAATVEAD
ncbi:MAG: hypothetical protein ACI8ZM_002930 [Crocinitomix sp.]|jgi:hypothetical protein